MPTAHCDLRACIGVERPLAAFDNWNWKRPIVCTNLQFRTPWHILIDRMLFVVEGKELPKLFLVGIRASDINDAVGPWTMDCAPVGLVAVS